MRIGTLGPKYTNSEMASNYYLKSKNITGDVSLYETPEISVEALIDKQVDVAILCIVYPKLNNIVFKNLNRIEIRDVFFFPTDEMVIAVAREGTKACSHPAPIDLINSLYKDVDLVTSNSEAARLCALGEYDACVTTLKAARKNNLAVDRSYGPVGMGWAVFERRS